MNLQQLFDQVIGGVSPSGPQNAAPASTSASAASSPLDAIKSALPGGLAGGAAAGGLMALLIGNKSARKMAGKAATYGGTALLGGLAYKAFQNWRNNQAPGQADPLSEQDIQHSHALSQQTDPALPALHLSLIKAMIAAAKSDGHIDQKEQKHIFQAIDKMQLNADDKAVVLDCMTRDISIAEIAASVSQTEHKAELYLAAYLAIDVDHPKEQAYLNDLAGALGLPDALVAHLQTQVDAGIANPSQNPPPA